MCPLLPAVLESGHLQDKCKVLLCRLLNSSGLGRLGAVGPQQPSCVRGRNRMGIWGPCCRPCCPCGGRSSRPPIVQIRPAVYTPGLLRTTLFPREQDNCCVLAVPKARHLLSSKSVFHHGSVALNSSGNGYRKQSVLRQGHWNLEMQLQATVLQRLSGRQQARPTRLYIR